MTTDAPLRVLFVLPSFAGGGAERVLLTVLNGLDRTRFAPELAVLDDAGPLSDRPAPDVRRHVLGTPRLRHALPALRRVLRSAAPDLVLTTMGYLNMGVLMVANRRTAVVIREANQPEATEAALGSRYLAGLGYRVLYPRSARILCNAEAVRTALTARGVPEALISVVRNPVDVDAVRSAGSLHPPMPEDGERRDGPRFVAVGRLTLPKGFDRLVDWFLRFETAATMDVVGDGPLRASLEAAVAAANATDRVRFHGFLANPYPVVGRADALLLASRMEGMPNVALEALALGVPVIGLHGAGGLAELAAEAPSGAVRLAFDAAEFRAAAASVRPRMETAPPRESLLPAAYRTSDVIDAYAAHLLGAHTTTRSGRRHPPPVPAG